MASYYYDLKDNEIIPEDWLNPWAPVDRYVQLKDYQIRRLISWVEEDDKSSRGKDAGECKNEDSK